MARNIPYSTSISSLVLWLKVWGNEQVDYRWQSVNTRPNVTPPIKVQFATDQYTVGGHGAPVGIATEFVINDGEVTFNDFISPSPENYRVLRDVCEANFNFTLYPTSRDGALDINNQIYRYAGKDCCIVLWLYKAHLPFCFYLKGGVPKNGYVDPDNHGELYYCGLGKVPSASGHSFFAYTGTDYPNLTVQSTMERYNSNDGTLGFNEIMNISLTGDSTVTIDPTESFTWRKDCSIENETEPQLECDNCIANISDCCADEQFTTDVNEFSSLLTPDPYINSENGEEERTTYNANVHIAKVLRQSFKAFYALLSKISCQLESNKVTNDNLERIAKALENMDNHPEIIVSPSENVFVSRVRYNMDSDD